MPATDPDATQSERRQNLREDLKDRAHRYIKQLHEAADQVSFELDASALVDPLRVVRNGDFDEAVARQDKTVRAARMLNELLDRKTEHYNRRFAHDLDRPETPSKRSIKNLFNDMRDQLELGADTELLAWDQLRERVEERLEKPVRITYSCDPWVGDYRIDNLDTVAHEGRLKIVHPNRYGEGLYESDVLESPTYGELAVHANRMAQRFGYRDSRFFEGITIRDRSDVEADLNVDEDVEIARISMGS